VNVAEPRPRSASDPRRWTLWRQPRRLIGYFLTAEAAAAGLTVWFALHEQDDARQWSAFAILAAMALLQAELSYTIEKARRLTTNAPHVNMTTVWCYAAVVTLPPGLAGTLVISVYAHLWVRLWRKMGTRPAYRAVFSTAIIVLSAYVAAGVVALGRLAAHGNWTTSPVAVLAVAAGALTYLAVNSALVALAGALHGKPTRMTVTWSDYALEAATFCLGIVAAFLLAVSPYVVVVVLPPLLVLHRSVLVKHLEELATTDGKTGLLNAAAWHEVAKAELSRAGRHQSRFGVLMIDLDHFKRVNDAHGHLAGDEVLRAVAGLLANEIREYDCAGRFGGEEFAVLIPDSLDQHVVTTAERLRRRITELEIAAPTGDGGTTISGLSVSIGVAVYPTHGTTLERLMLTADSALYTAKAGGRNQVVMLTD
jgi:diguanylate cyclase (GGDEF)-like protein